MYSVCELDRSKARTKEICTLRFASDNDVRVSRKRMRFRRSRSNVRAIRINEIVARQQPLRPIVANRLDV